jgi:hypothetical protein
LLDSEEWADEFERGPEGPALHVLVVDSGGQVAGHHSVIPLRFRYRDRPLLVGKGEAIYVDRSRVERGARVLVGGRPQRIVEALGKVLFARYGEIGVEAYIGYGQPQSETRLVEAGCSLVEIDYRRFFHVHDGAALVGGSSMPAGWRGVAAQALLAGYRALPRLGSRRARGPDITVRQVDSFDAELDSSFRAGLDVDQLALDPAADQLNWRFPGRLYRTLLLGNPPWGYAVLTPVEPSGRRRVVDWLVPAERAVSAASICRALAAASDDAAALEWSVPVASPAGLALGETLASTLLRDPRRRSYRMLVHGGDPFDRAERWSLTLATQERF